MDRQESVFEELKQEVGYAQRSYSEQLLYQAYGKAQMARQLEAITQDEFMEINSMTVRFMNTDHEYIRRKNLAYTNSFNPKNGIMTLIKIIAMGLVDDNTEVYVCPNADFRILARGNRHSDAVLNYANSELESFTWWDDNKFYVELKDEKEGRMKPFRVKYWREDEDGRAGYMEFDTREEAQAFYDSLDGKAEIQRYVEAIHAYETVVYPTFEV